MSYKSIIFIYVTFIASACIFDSIPIKWREIFFVIMAAFLMPFVSGYLDKNKIWIVIINSIFLPVGMFLPRFIDGSIARKVETMDHVLIKIYFSLIGAVIAMAMFYFGVIARKIKNAKNKNNLYLYIKNDF